GGTRPAGCERSALHPAVGADGDGKGREAGSALPAEKAVSSRSRFFVPPADERPCAFHLPWKSGREGMFSYSSLAPAFAVGGFGEDAHGDGALDASDMPDASD